MNVLASSWASNLAMTAESSGSIFRSSSLEDEGSGGTPKHNNLGPLAVNPRRNEVPALALPLGHKVFGRAAGLGILGTVREQYQSVAFRHQAGP
jgi:hypothetical protein